MKRSSCVSPCCAALCIWLASLAPLGARPAAADDGLDLVAVSLELDRLAEASFEEMLARERRVIEVSTRLRRAGVGVCEGGRLVPVLGLQVTSVREMATPFIPAVVRRFPMTENLLVLWVMPNSPAARAGFQAGDEILSVDGFEIRTERDLSNRRAADGAKSLLFARRRGGEVADVEVAYEPGCYVQPMLVLDSRWNAGASRGERLIIVTSELVREVRNDDELAAVIGHEMGHILLGHDQSKPLAEADADYFGLYLAARAGYDPAVGADIWQRMARRRPWALVGGESHPSAPQRTSAALRAIEEIRAKRSAGQALRPEGLE